MTTATGIRSEDRFTKKGHECPICGGYDSNSRGDGERCYGFYSADKKYATCTREEHAGNIVRNNAGYPHLMEGECRCGVQHGVKIRPALADKKDRGRSSSATSTRNEDIFTYDDARATAKYHYRNAGGAIVYTVVRYQWPSKKQPGAYEKTFRPFRWVGQNTAYGLPPEDQRVLYNLPELLAAPKDQLVYIPEGEKDVDTLKKLGLLAVCNVSGAAKGEDTKKWLPSYSEALAGRHVVILPDNDPDGQAHARNVKKGLAGKAASIQVIDIPGLPEKGDVSDFVSGGGTRDQLEKLVKPPRKSKFTYASEVKPEEVQWLWKRRIARGMGTLLVGDPGLGKSTLTYALIAAVTTGGMLPDNNTIAPGGVILMSPEDSEEHTIVPRLIAAGADLSKVILLTTVTDYDAEGSEYQRAISFPEDAHILEEAIRECGAALAIIDPVLSMMDMKYDSHKDQAVRFVMDKILRTAKEQNCAVVGVMHVNKSQSSNALHRSGGSIAFIGVFRVGLYVVRDPENEGGGVIVNHKNNLSSMEKTASIRYAFNETEQEISYITWAGPSSYTRDQLLNQGTPNDNPTSEQEQGLLEVLRSSDYTMTVRQIHERLTTGQSVDALEKMLKRKVDQGICWRPAKGKYTYAGNILYTEKEHVGNVGSVHNVGNSEENGYMKKTDISESNVGNENACEEAPEAAPEETDITDIDSVSVPMSETHKTAIKPPPELDEMAKGTYIKLLAHLKKTKSDMSVMWVVPGQDCYPHNASVTKVIYAEQMKQLLMSGDTRNIQAAIDAIELKLGKMPGRKGDSE